MSDLANLNDQQNLTLTQISYSSNMLAKHHGKTFAEIHSFISAKNPDDRSEEEKNFLKLMEQFPKDKNPYANYTVKGTANNQSSGFGAVAFTDDKGNTGFSYRGTDGPPSKKSANDWLDNAIAGITGDSTQCNEAEVFFERYSDPEGNNYLYGHSKGGNLSEYVYVKNYEKIKGMHLLNPQPINPWTLSKKQLEAIRSDKVDIVIVEGDYVWFIGMLPSYGNVRVVDSNGGDSHSYWSIDFKHGSASPGQHPWWEFAVYSIVFKISPYIQGTGVIFGFLCECIGEFNKYLKKGWDKCKEFCIWVADKLKKAGQAFKELADNIGEFFVEVYGKAKEWYKSKFDSGYKYASANPKVVIDTRVCRNYAISLNKINKRVETLDGRIDNLYWSVGFQDLWNLRKADALLHFNINILKCCHYLDETAKDFEDADRVIKNKL